MPSLHHGAIVIGVFLIVTGGATAFLTSSHGKLQAFSLCCVVLGALLLVLGLFWAMNGKSNPGSYGTDYSHVLFNPPGNFAESQSVMFQRTLERQRCAVYGEDFDYPPVEPSYCSPPGRPPHWDLEPPPPMKWPSKPPGAPHTCAAAILTRCCPQSPFSAALVRSVSKSDTPLHLRRVQSQDVILSLQPSPSAHISLGLRDDAPALPSVSRDRPWSVTIPPHSFLSRDQP